MQLGIAIADRDLPADAGVSLAGRVDGSSVHSLWTNETAGADACVTLGAWAASTRRLVLATGVVPLSARSTATLDIAARQIERMAPGRLLLGIGVGQRSAAEGLHERTWRPPLEWTGDALERLRGHGYPVIVGALGPRMLELAAARADGVLSNWSTAAFSKVQAERVGEVASATGRDRSSLVICGYVRIAAGAGAESALASQIGFYSGLPFYREHWQAMGSPANSEVALASKDGSDLVERLQAWDAFDVVVARIVPTEDFGVERLAGILAASLDDRGNT